jgi:predicted TIM-barrel fold metal-dependent hydrolase
MPGSSARLQIYLTSGSRSFSTVSVAGFTSLPAKLDPEDLHEIADGSFRIVVDVIHRSTSTVNEPRADRILAPPRGKIYIFPLIRRRLNISMFVVDFHVHISHHYLPWVSDYAAGFRDTSKLDRVVDEHGRMSPEPLAEILAEEGVNYAVVLAEMSPVTTGMSTNEDVAEFCQGMKAFIPFANINPHLVARPAEELKRCVNDLGMKGLKLYPTYQNFYSNDSALYPVYSVAEELGLPVMVHTGSSIFRGARLKYGDPLHLDDVAVDFPQLRILLVHGGRGFWYDKAFFLTRMHENVYLEISGLPPQRLLEYFPRLEEIGDKVVFGSDWPALPSIGHNVQAIRDLEELTPATRANLVGLTAARLLGLPVEPDSQIRNE